MRAPPARFPTTSRAGSTPVHCEPAAWSSMPDRFARTAEQVAAHQDERAAALAGIVHTFVLARGDERAVDVGTGAGALAFALAPIVREVVGVDRVPELLELARERGADHRYVTCVEGDVVHLLFVDGSCDLACMLRTLQHCPRAGLSGACYVCVTCPG